MRRFLASLRSSTALARFARDRRGNVATIFALLAVPAFGVIGAAVDYREANRVRTQLQEAADAGALAGARALHLSDAAVTDAVQRYLAANLPRELANTPFRVTIRDDRRTIVVTLNRTVPTQILPVVGVRSFDVAASSEATYGNDRVEVALALDVTGSMANHIGALQQAARQLVEILFMGEQTSRNVSVSLVPYAAAVNIGNGPRQMAWMDVDAQARFHGQAFESVRIPDNRCWTPPPPPPPRPPVVGNPRPPSPPPPTPQPPGPPQPPPSRPPGNDLGFLTDFEALGRLAEAAGAVIDRAFEAIGPARAQAQSFGWSYGAAPTDMTPTVDTVHGNGTPCDHRTPSRINHFTLFQSMGVQWRGCVEARPAPFDTDDTPPSRANPDTLFVPYLWPDERDNDSSIRNNYLRLNPATDMPAWVGTSPSDRSSRNDHLLNMAWVWRYRGQTPRIDDAAGTQIGPNAGCPTPIVPLTQQRAQIDNAINGLRVYRQGGTVIPEGLAWAWRTLSPGEPFGEGAPYGTRGNRKIVVLMTDGANFVVDQGNALRSDYTAYGYARYGRLGSSNIDQMREELDRRTRTICQSMRGRDVTVFTVMFDPQGGLAGTPTDLLRNCATTPDRHFYRAGNAQELVAAFNTIGAEIARLRISR